MPLSDEMFQRQVLADLAAIKANQSKDEKSFDLYRAKVDQLISVQATNVNSLKDAHKHIDKLEDDMQSSEQRVREDIAKEVSSIYRTAAIVGACVSFVISVILQRLG